MALKKIQETSRSANENLKQFRYDLTINNTLTKPNTDWIDSLEQIFKKNDEVIEMLAQTKVFGLHSDSMPAIYEKYFSYGYFQEERNISIEFKELFEKLAEINIPIDTLEIMGYSYYSKLFESNKKALKGNETPKKGFARFISLFRANEIPKYLKQKMDEAAKSIKDRIKAIKKIIDKLTKTLMLLQPAFNEIKTNLISMNFENGSNNVENIYKNISLTVIRVGFGQWTRQVLKNARKIYFNVEEVVTVHEKLQIDIEKMLPYRTDYENKIVMVSKPRLLRVHTRLYTIASNVKKFVEDFEPFLLKTIGAYLPKWMQPFVRLTSERAKINEIFVSDFELISEKTANRVRMLLDSDPLTKKDEEKIIPAIEEYLTILPNITILFDIDYVNFDCDNYYSNIYHTQFLIPYRMKLRTINRVRNDRLEKQVIDYCDNLEKAHKDIKDRIEILKSLLKTDIERAIALDLHLGSLETALEKHENAENRKKNIQEIMKLIKLDLIQNSPIDKNRNNHIYDQIVYIKKHIEENYTKHTGIHEMFIEDLID